MTPQNVFIPTAKAWHSHVRRKFIIMMGVGVLSACVPTQSVAKDVNSLDTILEATAEYSPGAILLVNSPDIQFHKATGYSERKAKTPIRKDSTLRIGSITKTYVAALAMMAVKDGRLDLDATLDDYLDPDVLQKLPEGPRPTVRQLLNHTSGIPDYYSVRFYMKDWKDRGPLTTELVLHAIRGKKATGKPGEAFEYSNTNYHLIALILEGLYATSFENLLQDHIFDSVNLKETYYGKASPHGDDIHGYGAPTKPWQDTYLWEENSGPDGGMFATATDIAKWIETVFKPNGDLVELGNDMLANPVREGDRKLQGMGVEILVSKTGKKVVGHTGALDGYSTAAFYVPSSDAIIVFHINRTHEKGFSRTLGDILRYVMATDTK